jgi:hypothetical protein
VALREIIGDLIEEFEDVGSSIKMHAAIKAGRPRVMADPDALVMLVDEGLQRHLKRTATTTLGSDGTRMRKSANRDDPRQTNMYNVFGLKPRYALDNDDLDVKRTDWLTRAEVRKLREVRQKQLFDDTRHLEKIATAEDTVGPLWDDHPDLLFGQIIELYLRLRQESA